MRVAGGEGTRIIRILPGLPTDSRQAGFSLMLNGQGKTKSFRFSPKGGKIPRYNLGEIISPTFDTMSRATIQRAEFSAGCRVQFWIGLS